MEDMDLVATWLRKDKVRWTAGVMAGLLAGLVMMVFAAVLCAVTHHDILFPVKVAALPILGSSATEVNGGTGAILVGLVCFEALAALLGFVYAHFTQTNSMPALLGMGVVWALFSWIFLENLFFQSWKPFYWTAIPSGAAFFAWLVFGLSLSSVSVFDKMLRGNARG